jgi:hypothetical protein
MTEQNATIDAARPLPPQSLFIGCVIHSLNTRCYFVIVTSSVAKGLKSYYYPIHTFWDTQNGKNADCVDVIKKTAYTLCVTVLS